MVASRVATSAQISRPKPFLLTVTYEQQTDGARLAAGFFECTDTPRVVSMLGVSSLANSDTLHRFQKGQVDVRSAEEGEGDPSGGSCPSGMKDV